MSRTRLFWCGVIVGVELTGILIALFEITVRGAS